jgi:hypothetical protein
LRKRKVWGMRFQRNYSKTSEKHQTEKNDFLTALKPDF